MTKKDYELVAKAFNADIGFLVAYYPVAQSERTDKRKGFDTALNHSIQTARRLSKLFENENPRFDRIKFLRACGMTDNQLMNYGEIEKTTKYNMFSKI